MSLNCSEIQAILNHIPQKGLIRKYSQQDDKTLVITYQPDSENIYDLFICVNDKNNYICAGISANNRFDELKFSQFLSSNLAFGKITAISQYKLSRIVDIAISNGDKISHLICRLWGSGGNILLTDSHYVIQECLHRYPKRGEWPGEEIILDELVSNNTNYAVREIFDNDNINNVVCDYYQTLIHNEKIKKIKSKLISLCQTQTEILEQKLSNIRNNSGSPEYYLQIGELLKSNAYKIKDFQEKCEVFDYASNTTQTIPLKKNLTVMQNMQYYFEKYKKSLEAQSFIQEQKDTLQLKLNQIKKIAAGANADNDLTKLNQLQDSFNLLCGKKNKKGSTHTFGRMFILANNTKTFVSKNAKDADQLLKRVAKGNDYWFHIRDYAGSHVIVKNEKNKPIDPQVKIQAAHLALYYSQLRTDSNLSAISEGDVYFTQIKYLHKPNSNTPGLVFPTQEKNIKVNFKKSIIDQILDGSTV